MSLSILRLATLQRAVFLVNSRLGQFAAASASSPWSGSPAEAPLLPKLRGQVAEFLKEGSLARLRILSSPTCVGLRYGHSAHSLGAFLGNTLQPLIMLMPSHHLRRVIRLLARIAYCGFTAGCYPRPRLSALRPPIGSLSCAGGEGMLTFFPSTTPFGLALGAG